MRDTEGENFQKQWQLTVNVVKWPSKLEDINKLLNLTGILGDRIPR